jgi:hypothetical protein
MRVWRESPAWQGCRLLAGWTEFAKNTENTEMIVITVPSTEFAKNFGHYREIVQAEPVAVTSHNRVTGYFISRREFDELVRLKARATKAYAVQDLPEEAIQALANSRMDARHDTLNELLAD